MLRFPFSIQATKARVAKYRALLLAPWNRALPARVLELLDSVAIGAPDWLRSPSPCPLPNDFAKFLDHLRWSVHLVRIEGMPPLPESYEIAGRTPRAAWQAVRIAGYLMLPATHGLGKEAGFFRDVQALAFQAAIELLPDVSNRKDEQAILLHALALFPLEYSASDPAHYSYLMSQVHQALGHEQEHLIWLEAAFRFTEPHDHSYLTKAQEVWSELLSRRKHEEAERFLFALQRNCLPAQLEEVQAMTVDALKFMMAAHDN